MVYFGKEGLSEVKSILESVSRLVSPVHNEVLDRCAWKSEHFTHVKRSCFWLAAEHGGVVQSPSAQQRCPPLAARWALALVGMLSSRATPSWALASLLFLALSLGFAVLISSLLFCSLCFFSPHGRCPAHRVSKPLILRGVAVLSSHSRPSRSGGWVTKQPLGTYG